MLKQVNTWLVLASALALTGCFDSRQEEVASWMSQQKSLAVPKVRPLTEPAVFSPIAYDRGGEEDPFSFQKMARVFGGSTARTSDTGLLDVELARRKEPLESYPLDIIKMVGFMQKDGRPTALLSVDRHLYQVVPGNYLGENYGRITSVNETGLNLREIVQDATGDWVERSTVVSLQE